MHAFVQSTALGFLKIMIGNIGKKSLEYLSCLQAHSLMLFIKLFKTSGSLATVRGLFSQY